MLKGARSEATDLGIDVVAFAIPCLHMNARIARNLTTNTRNRQTAFHVVECVIVEEGDDRVDQNGERNARLVWVARVVVHFDCTNALVAQHLCCCQTGTICMAHGFNEVVNELLHFGRSQLFACYFFGDNF